MSSKPSQTAYSLTLKMMIDAFNKQSYVISDSPKTRRKFYKYLADNNIKFSTELIGYTSGARTMCQYMNRCHRINWTYGRIIHYIDLDRILADDLKSHCNDIFKFEDIESIFDKTLDKSTRCQIIVDKWSDQISNCKYTPFDNVTLKTSIKKIIKIE